jgi:hypothetical protein
MLSQTNTATCTADTTTQKQPNSEDRTANTAAPFGLRTLWLHFANDWELRRLARLHMRIERKKCSLAEQISERQKIMNRCIRRMRRASGKN